MAAPFYSKFNTEIIKEIFNFYFPFQTYIDMMDEDKPYGFLIFQSNKYISLTLTRKSMAAADRIA